MLGNIRKGEPLSPDHPILSTPLPAILEDAFQRFAMRECVTWGDQRYTYADVDAASARIANRLHEAGVREGEHAAVYSRNSVSAFIATLGVIRAGAVWIPVNPMNALASNIDLLVRFQVSVLFYQQSVADAAQAVREKVPTCKVQVCLDGPDRGVAPDIQEWSANASTKSPAPELGPDDLVSIPMTGGTTGTPRGVMLTQRNFASITYAMCESVSERDEPFAMLCSSPMSHVSGRFVVTSMPAGGRYVIMDGVEPQKILLTIEQDRITDLFLPPTGIYKLLAQPNVRDFDYSSLCQFMYGSAPMAVGKLREALEVFGPVMRGGYGQSECPMFITALWQEEHFENGKIASDERLSSVGRATVVSKVAILNEQGEPLAQGETGEIAVKSPNVFAGYWNEPELSKKLELNGWHLTTDIGRFDADGFLHIVDRKKDVIISGGFNIYSAEVEEVVAQVPGVYMAVVIGVPSDKWGEEVKALVQRESRSGVTAEQIIQHAKQVLGSVRAPKSVDFVEEFPRTPVGKVDKKAIRAPFWERADRWV